MLRVMARNVLTGRRLAAGVFKESWFPSFGVHLDGGGLFPTSPPLTPALSPDCHGDVDDRLSSEYSGSFRGLFDSIWFAVPKKKVSKSKKRMKHGLYKLKNKVHIVRDRVTGEWTERHRLPLNWKFYLRPDGYGPKRNRNGEKIDASEEEKVVVVEDKNLDKLE